ncbi:hypothetical protein ONZ51_g10591 [Trametes cubensis]|uniref:DUF6535 domain-containing protein n=1 Tax=Trametes cubensis TaxID=1111947 RepID=A0AAD7TJ58_9APHY|nr:hypothetical protein ONZ51_g10591 [Trametes cubensis]
MVEIEEGSANQSGGPSEEPRAGIANGQAFLASNVRIGSIISTLYMWRYMLFTDEEQRDAFTKTAAISQEYSKALVERWIKEIDTYLVYAGLFSAILTAFNVESYQLLQPASPIPSPLILQHISLQLSSLTYIPPSINSTYPAFTSSGTSATASSVVPTWAIWLNALWFSGLVLSLSAASVGILVKQWLNEFQSGLSGDSEHVAKLCQYRLNNLKRCHVGSIVNAIPVLLQGALALFLAGLLVLLWNLHRVVAAVTSLFVFVIAVFIVGTTIAPLIAVHCTYLSPQSLVLYALWPYVPHYTRKMLVAMKMWLSQGFGRVRASLDSPAVPIMPRNSSVEPPQQSWIARERSVIDDDSVGLEMDIYGTAYEATLDSDVIFSATARVVRWESDDTCEWLGRLGQIDTFHFGTLQDHDGSSDHVLHAAIFYGYILLFLTGVEEYSERSSDASTCTLTGSAFSREEVEDRFLRHLRQFKYWRPKSLDNAPYGWGVQLAWILGTHATLALCALEAEHDSHGQPPSTSRIVLERWNGEELELCRLNLMARIIGLEALPSPGRYDLLVYRSMERCVAFAYRTLQASDYSRNKPFEHLGTHLRAHAHLLYAAVLSSHQRSYQIVFLDEGMKVTLSDLIATLDNLSRSILNVAYERAKDVQEDIIGPLSHIVRTLSYELDFFRPFLPPDFCVQLEAFFSSFKQSEIFRRWHTIRVPWNEDWWFPSNLYDAAQALIAKLRDSASPTRDTPAIHTASGPLQPQSNTAEGASISSTPRQTELEEMSKSAGLSAAVTETLPGTQSCPDASHRHTSASYQADPWMYYGDDYPEVSVDGASPSSTAELCT